MDYAKKYDCVVLTNDLDFGFILAIKHGKKPSIIQTRTGVLSPDRIGGMVIGAIQLFYAEIEQGALVTIGPQKARVRLLPL